MKDQPTPIPAAPSRFRSIASTFAGGAVADLVLFGLTVATAPSLIAATPLPPAPILSPADATQLRTLMAEVATALQRFLGDPVACPGSVEMIHPVWPR